MSRLRITKEFTFEGAHALTGYDGKCRHIHGHSYKLFVTLTGEIFVEKNHPKTGMVIDFSILKKIVSENIIERYDHALLLSSDATLKEELIKEYDNVIIVDFQPTCENLISDFAKILIPKLPTGVTLHSLKLHETATSFVEWFAQDNN